MRSNENSGSIRADEAKYISSIFVGTVSIVKRFRPRIKKNLYERFGG
jgi:hypothetical protein